PTPALAPSPCATRPSASRPGPLVGRPPRRGFHTRRMAELRPYECILRESRTAAVREAGEYFAGGGWLHETLRRLATRLEEERIVYALVGGMALGEYGYVRMTDDINVLVTLRASTVFTSAAPDAATSRHTRARGTRFETPRLASASHSWWPGSFPE